MSLIDRRSAVVVVCSVLASAAWAVVAVAQDAPPPMPADAPKPEDLALDPDAWRKLNALNDSIMDKMMTDNGWNSEADVIVLKMQDKLKATQAFDVDRRLGVIIDTMGERYNLRQEQKTYLKNMMIRESVQYMYKNSGQVMEVIRALKAEQPWNQPITPQVAQRYVQMYRPLMESTQELLTKATAEFMTQLDEDQKKLYTQDWELAKQRFEVAQKQMIKWEGGQWSPEEWGLGADGQILLDGQATRRLRERIRAQAGAGAPAPQPNPGADAGPAPAPAHGGGRPTVSGFNLAQVNTWASFVEQYIKYYGLDAAVAGSARGILANTLGQARSQSEKIAAKTVDLQAELKKKDLAPERRAELEKKLAEANAPLSDLFNEMVKRLDNLLTSEQAKKPPMPGHPKAPKAAPGKAAGGAAPAPPAPAPAAPPAQ